MFDTLIDQARAARDDAARLVAYRKAEARAFDIMPLIPIVFFRNHVGVAERVHDLQIDGAGLFDAASAWVSKP
jgi:ABC-type oligopeptide transport system substrate-binding subunit